jgi:hypothetical protein
MNSYNKIPIGPTIPANTNYDSNYSGLLQTDSIRTQILTDGIATLQGGFLTGIINPIDDQDAIPKSYIIGSVPGGPPKSIQYNKDGVFSGSANFRYLGGNTGGTVSIPNVIFRDDYLSINGGLINNLQESSNGSYAVTRRYCDFLKNNNTVTTTDSVSGQTYDPSEILNSTLIRVNYSTTVDLLPSADSIVSFLNNQANESLTTGSMATSGLFYNFTLINQGSNNVVMFGNTGTFLYSSSANSTISSIIVPRDYILRATVYIVDTVSPLVRVYIDSLCWSVLYISNFFGTTGFNTFLPYYARDNIIIPGPIGYTPDTTTAVTYSLATVKQGIIFRDPTAAAIDIFDNILINTSFVIQNISAFSVSIDSANCTGTWTFNPSGILTISSGKSAYLWLNADFGTNILNVLSISDM